MIKPLFLNDKTGQKVRHVNSFALKLGVSLSCSGGVKWLKTLNKIAA